MFKQGIWAAATGSTSYNYRSLEDYGVDEEIVNPVTNEVVGEADSEIADIAVESLAISQEMDEIQRTTAVAEAGEVISDVAGSVAGRDATPEEAALVQAGAAQTAIAAGATASDVAEVAEQVATESAGKFKVSNENFVETIKNLWKKLKEWVMGLVNKIKQTWNRFWNSTESLKKKAKKLKELLKDKKDSKKDDKLEKWSGYFRNITAGSTFNPTESLKAFGSLGKDTAEVTKKIVERIEATTSGVKEISKNTNKIADVTETIMARVSSGSENVSDYLGNGFKGQKKVLPFGNKATVTGYDSNKNLSETAKINSYTAKLVDDKKSFDPKPKDFKVDYLTKSQVEGIADDVDNLAKALEDWYNKGSKDADKKIDELRKEVDKEVDAINEGADANAKDAAKIMQRFYTVPTQDLRLSMEVCTYMIRTANDMLSFGFLNAKNLEDDKKD